LIRTDADEGEPMPTTIIHWSERGELLAKRGFYSSASWAETFDGTLREAEDHLRDWYGRAGRVDRSPGQTVFRFVGFMLTIRSSEA
jgi:hypothetical protein